MEPTLFAILCLAAASAAVLSYLRTERRAIRRVLASAPHVAIGDLREGTLAKVHGRIEPIGALLRAPFTGRACVAWRVTVEVRGAKGSRRKIVEEHGEQDFLLQGGRPEGGAKLRVEARALKMLTLDDFAAESGFRRDPSPELQAFLAARGHAWTDSVFNRSLTFVEGILEPGERVTVMGLVGAEPDPSLDAALDDYRAPPRRACLLAPPAGSVLVSAEPASAP